MKTLLGGETDLSQYQGKVIMIVNVASECGATPQYADIQALYEKYKDQGFVVLGFPCNQFGGQEPGSAQEISEFCTRRYGVDFPMFAKIDVNGDEAAPLYQYLTSKDGYPSDAGRVKWNFEKFLISKDGKVVERFRTRTQPDDPNVITAIERELAAE
nr:glutathione peroxidase [Calycomorphotria hydatis]